MLMVKIMTNMEIEGKNSSRTKGYQHDYLQTTQNHKKAQEEWQVSGNCSVSAHLCNTAPLWNIKRITA